MKTKKQISLLLAAVMLISIFAGIFATPSKPTFSDVPADHWAYEFVEKAAKEGWVAGVGNGRFGVDNQVTYAEFATMLTRAYFSDELEAYSGPTDKWYTSFFHVADDAGLFAGTELAGIHNADDSLITKALNRYNMAAMLVNVLKSYDAVPNYDVAAVRAGIGDWNNLAPAYCNAVQDAVGAGLISGVNSRGDFSGDGYMFRSQAAVVMVRLNEVVNKAADEPLVDPETTPTPPAATGSWSLKNGKAATPENVIEMLKEIEKQYPTGTPWTDPTTNPDTPHNPNPVSQYVGDVMEGGYHIDSEYACGGFAAMVSDLIFPEEAKMREVTDFSKVRPGDIVFDVGRDGKTVGHVWIVLGESWFGEETGLWQVSGRADGNWAKKISWAWDGGDAIWKKDEVPGFGHNVIYTRYPD